MLVSGALLAAALCTQVEVHAAPTWLEADKHFRHGVELYKESNYAAALVEFQRAYEIDPKFQVLYNIGETQYQLQDYAGALATFRRYLDEGKNKIGFKRRKDVEAEIVTLSKRVAKLGVRTNEDGATISIDDVVVGTSPLEPIVVSAGRRKVTAALSGRVPVTRMIDLAGGDDETIELEIAPLPKPVEIVKPPPAPPPPPPSAVPMVIGWSVTGALVAGGAITGVLALGASSDLEDELARYPGDPVALGDAQSKSTGLALATDLLFGASIAAAAVSTYFTIDYLSQPTDADASGAAEGPSARLVVHPTGLGLVGRF
jgi:tetratricopeptide (TPR) repeat protein